MRLSKARVLMICADHPSDRRVMREAATLVRNGYEVIVISRAGNDLPESELVDGVKIHRIDAGRLAEKRALNIRIAAAFAVFLKKRTKKLPDFLLSLFLADKTLPAKLSSRTYGPPWLDEWIHRQNWAIRNALKALLWPPYRLQVLRYYLPSLSAAGRYAIYLPTLLLTPRPRAIRWHWACARLWLQAWGEQMRRRRAGKIAWTTTNSWQTLNPWETAVIEHGRFYRPDIVHAHDLPQLRSGVLISEELGVPLIYDVREPRMTTETALLPENQKLKIVEKHFIRSANHIIGANSLVSRVLADNYNIAMPTVLQSQDEHVWSSQEKTLLDIYRNLLEPAARASQAAA